VRWKVVIDDVDKAHEAFIHSYRLHPAHQKELRKNGIPREKGTVHTIADDECPEGKPNCRNCGDPEFAQLCRAAGHCHHCGTRHGIAPQSMVEFNGYILVKDDA